MEKKPKNKKSSSSSYDTPMMRQYLAMKEEVPDCILMFRMGDFYEMFMEDAKVASRVLGIALTSRDKSSDHPIPMCGVPHMALDQYLATLVEAGFKVAICDQVEDPRQAKGLVKRQITRVVSPGMFTDPKIISSKDNRYLAAIYFLKENNGLAYMDLSSGEFMATTLPAGLALNFELARIEPWELVVAAQQNRAPFLGYLGEQAALPRTPVDLPSLAQANELLHELVNGPVEEEQAAGFIAAAMLWTIVLETQRCVPEHIRELDFYESSGHLALDQNAMRNLEMFRSLMDGGRKGSLLASIDKTVTPMGARLLREWLSMPLRSKQGIEARQQAISELAQDYLQLCALRDLFKELPDLPRLMGRIGLNQAGPRELAALRACLCFMPDILIALKPYNAPLIKEAFPLLSGLEDVRDLLIHTLAENPPLAISEGGVIAPGVDFKLDELRELASQGKGWVSSLQQALREQTGISSLKIGFNKVFGYYIEVTNAHQDKVPPEFIRKQTLAGGERYITFDLKEKESSILNAEENANALEMNLFTQLRRKMAERSVQLMAMSRALARLDVLSGLALLAFDKAYVRPVIVDADGPINIAGGRHPVVEDMLPRGEFVPNDVLLDSEQQVLIITGPNMAGKSTILRQVAIIAILAQMGSFVPAESATVPIVDRIFTRVGAQDNLARGQSTFMVEMVETSQILKEATNHSLVILDEVGRGTSTFDGLSLAWAVVEHLHNLNGMGVKTMFATHYHELVEIAATCPRVRNFNVAVKEFKGDIVFMRRLAPGGVSRSYGLQVAKLAGLPQEVLSRAQTILTQLEEENILGQEISRSPQMSLFVPSGKHPVLDALRATDTVNMTPLEALNLLEELKGALD